MGSISVTNFRIAKLLKLSEVMCLLSLTFDVVINIIM